MNINSKSFCNHYHQKKVLELVNFFLNLGYPYDAYRVSSTALKHYPNDISIIAAHQKTLEIITPHTKDTSLQEEAIDTAQMATALDPENKTFHRQLAKAYQTARMWDEANSQWVEILDKQATPSQEDLRAYAECAWQAGFKEQAIKACNYGLKLNPEDGLIYLLLAQIHEADGKQKKAYENYSKSLKFTPEQPEVWLGYADSLAREKKTKEALAILKRGLNANPNNLPIKQKIGEIHLKNKNYTEALEHLETVRDSLAELPVSKNNHLRIKNATALGALYIQTEKYQKAIEALQEVHAQHPTETAIAYQYASALLAAGHPQEAIPPLVRVIQSTPQDTAPYMDYAKALLSTQQDPQEAIQALDFVLSKEPENHEALALRGDAYAQNNQFEKALLSYQNALETPLKEDPSWSVRLLLGTGKVALQMKKTDMAIAALKQAQAEVPDNVDVLKTLADAYLQAKLPENASEISNVVLHKFPEDVDTHLWYAKIAKSLSRDSEAIKVLKRAKEIAPDRQDILVALGKTYYEAGNNDLAHSTFADIAGNQNAGVDELRTAAEFLLKLNDNALAADALVRALSIAGKSNTMNKAKVEIALDLAQVYQQQDKPEEAVKLLEEISHESDNLSVKLMKVRLLHTLGRSQAALAALEDALNNNPDNAECHYLKAQLHRSLGDLVPALLHANTAMAAIPDNERTRLLAAGIQTALLDKKAAKELIRLAPSGKSKNIGNALEADKINDIQYPCTLAEFAMEENDEIEAANALTIAMKLSGAHPRVMAIQARLAARRGEIANANQILTRAVEALESGEAFPRNQAPIAGLTDETGSASGLRNTIFSAEDYFGVAEAAIDLHQWDTAYFLTKEGARLAPFEPQSHLKIARLLAERAEMERMCVDLLVKKHAPGETAIAHTAYEEFENAIDKTNTLLSGESIPEKETAETIIRNWQLRGEAVFNPGRNLPSQFDQTIPERSLAFSHIEALRLLGDIREAAEKASGYLEKDKDFILSTPKYALIIGLGLAGLDAHKAVGMLQKAAELAEANHHLSTPLLYALLGITARKDGDHQKAVEAIENALEMWEDEPEWHAFYADTLLEMETGNNRKSGAHAIPHHKLADAISHRERCIRLEPGNIHYQVSLAKTYRLAGRLFDAIKQLEETTRENPDRPEAWMALAGIYRTGKETEKAVAFCKKAVEIDPDNQENLIFYTNLLVENEDYQNAEKMASQITREDPQNAKAYQLLAQSLIGLNRKEEAIEALERAQILSPNDIGLELEKVNLLRLTKGKEIAYKQLALLSERFPKSVSIQSSYAKELIQRNQFNDAIRVVKQTLNLCEEENPGKDIAELHYLLGNLYRRTGQQDHAIHHLSQSLSIEPENAQTYIEAGRAYQERHQYHKAIEAFESAIAISPNLSDPYYYAGLTYKSIKDYLKAESMFRKAAEYAPNDLNIHRQLGAMVAINLVHNRQSVVDNDDE